MPFKAGERSIATARIMLMILSAYRRIEEISHTLMSHKSYFSV
jgi:hypothetical protein